jgi:hypothetical protein
LEDPDDPPPDLTVCMARLYGRAPVARARAREVPTMISRNGWQSDPSVLGQLGWILGMCPAERRDMRVDGLALPAHARGRRAHGPSFTSLRPHRRMLPMFAERSPEDRCHRACRTARLEV